MRGDETLNTLWNLCQRLRTRKTSYLAAAMALDVDLYREQVARFGPPKTGKATPPDLVEFDLTASLLSGIFDRLGHLLHFTAAAAPEKTPKRPKVKPLPRPVTAKDLLAREETRAAFEHMESVIVFVPEDQWRRGLEAAREPGGDDGDLQRGNSDP